MTYQHRKTFIKMTLSLALAVGSQYSWAQNKKGDNLSDEQINVVKDYKPTLSDAARISSLPVPDSAKPSLPLIDYSISTRKINTQIPTPALKPIKPKDEAIPKLYKSLVKLGFGSYVTPYGELFLNSLRTKNYQFSAHAKHFSSSGQLEGVGTNAFSNNELELAGKTILNKESLSGSLSYTRDAVHYYGYNPDKYQFSEDSSKQVYNLGAIDIGVANHQANVKLPHDAHFQFYNLIDNFNNLERNVNFSLDLSKQVDFGLIRTDFKINYIDNIQKKQPSSDRFVTHVTPTVFKSAEDWAFTAGFTFANEAGAIGGIHVYPYFDGLLHLSEDYVILFGSVNGGIIPITYQQMRTENPFMNPGSFISNNTNNKLNVRAGLRGTISSSASYSVSTAFIQNNYMPLFVLDSMSAMPRFKLVYDNVNTFNIHAESAYQLYEKWRILGKIDLNNYYTSIEEKAWYLPSLTASLSAMYNIANKIYTQADIIAIGKRYYKTKAGADELPSVIDFNVGLEYRYSKIFSAFIRFNNLTNNRYYAWQGYPTQRFNVLGGITFSF